MASRCRRGSGSRIIGAVLALLVASAHLGPAVAQALPEPAAEALGRGQRAAAEALVSYTNHLPDRPLWSEALAAGREAARLAPDHPAPRRFLAQAYLEVGWYGRSWSAWQAYLDRGGTVDASVERQLIEVATWMSLNAYDADRPERVVSYLETVLRYAPNDLGANARLARLYLDRDESLAALPYLEALDGRAPDLIPALQRARLIDRYGPAAADAYTAATEARDAGSLTIALERFLEATELRPEFTDAWRGVAATAEQLGRLDEAEAAHRQVLTLAPDDEAALAGLGRIAAAEEQARAQAEAEAEAEAEAAAQAQAAAQAAAQEAAEREVAEQAAAEQAAAEQAAAEQAAAEQAAAEQAAAEQAAAEQAAAEQAAAEQAAAEQAAAEQAAAEARAQDVAEQAAQQAAAEAEQAAAQEAAAEREAAERSAAEQAAAEQAAAEQAAAEQAAAEQAAADRAAAEQAAAEQAAEAQAAEEQAATERAAAEAEARAAPSGSSLLLVDAVVEHNRSAAAASPSVAFVPAPGLADADLAGHTGDTIHVRVEVLDKPSDAPILYQLCLVPTDIAMRPACTDPSHLSFSGPGTYEGDQAWSDLAGFDGVDWREGIDSTMVVLRRPDGTPLESPRPGSEDGDNALDAYLPMTVRIQALAVPPGTPFPGWP